MPDGQYIIATERNDGPQSYRVNLVDAKSHKILDLGGNPDTRAIEVHWNSTSKLVAIDEDISHYTGNLSLFRIVDGRFESIFLPRRLLWENVKEGDGVHQMDAIYHYIPEADGKRIKRFWGACQPWASGWLNESDLAVNIGGTAQLDGHFLLTVSYDVVVRVVPPRISILSETKRKYEINEEKSK